MSVTRRFPLVFAALLFAGLIGLSTTAHAQGAVWDPPSGVGKTTQATGDLVPDPQPVTAIEAARIFLPGSFRLSPSMAFWPSASRLARLVPAHWNSPSGARLPALGPVQRQRTLAR